MNRFLKMLAVGIGLFLAGCSAYVIVDKRPNIALPVYDVTTSNITDYVIVDQGYEVKYSKTGFNTEIQEMSAEITTNKTVKFSLGGLVSNVSTNNIQIKLEDIYKIASLFKSATNDIIVIDKEVLMKN